MDKKKVFNSLLISVLLILGVYFVYATNSFSISSPATTEFFTRANFSITCTASELSEGYVFSNITLAIWNSTVIWNGTNHQYYTVNTSSLASDNASTFTINDTSFYNNIGKFELNYTYACLFANNTAVDQSSNKTFIIDNTAPKSLVLNEPNLSSVYTDVTSMQFGFYFIDLSSPTANCSLLIDGTSINDSIVVTNNTNYWMNVSIKGTFDSGYHAWNVTCYDKANNMNNTAKFNYTRITGATGAIGSGSNFTLTDTAGPTSVLTIADTTITSSATATITCAGTDLITNTIPSYQTKVTNPSGSISTTGGSSLSYTDTSTVGSYTVTCRSADTAGNWGAWTADQTITVSTSTSTITNSAGSSSSSSSSTVTATETTDVEAGATENLGTLTQTIANNVIMGIESVASFSMVTSSNMAALASHSVTVSEITDTSATIIIESEPITLTLEIGDIEQVDVDGDGINDLEVTLNDIIDEKADLTINTLVETPEELTEPTTPEPQPTPKAKSTTGWWIVLIIVVVGLLAWFFFFKKKK